ncbi:hypothetical protein SLAV_39295 [Streptomyces lavendulae subsp. lavendulae]|uniref:Uncharacterized protein n=1 Tax=Streptomyces lavendulae subsp. lavendulae TaxID=58340 RepID=A0A2K8P5B8_STRLA|nr:hypothetical protein [Streptomyces lavendulae]ATZ21949.1 hypothetical protein SLAV_00095 [Streptomyces lavendulae subsp. lavendulae]ATZ29622.1 hypothetical protein SLAV_39295 [Streptomyces lavendulae subsp. lavendulae]
MITGEHKDLYFDLAQGVYQAGGAQVTCPESGLPSTLWYSIGGLFSRMGPTAVQTWLTDQGIAAVASTKGLHTVVEYADPASARKMADLLRALSAPGREAATRLEEALVTRDVTATVDSIGLDTVRATVVSIEGASAAALAAALDAHRLVGDGAALAQHTGQHQFGKGLQAVLSVTVGSQVKVETVPDCRHAESELVLSLTVKQAEALTRRLT